MLYLKKANYDDIEKEYLFITNTYNILKAPSSIG